MTEKKKEHFFSKKTAFISSIALVIFLSGTFFLETSLSNIEISFGVFLFSILACLVIITVLFFISENFALVVPVITLSFYTTLMFLSGWHFSYYLLACLIICTISCLFSDFSRTLGFIIIQNLLIGSLFIFGVPVAGHGASAILSLATWAICLFISIILLLLTKTTTILLGKAAAEQNSFRELLDTTENYVAMINEYGEVVYGSKSLADLSETENPALLQGRPLIDLFPGRSLKTYAGKLLKKQDCEEEWEFSLKGQKRYFKAVSHNFAHGKGGALISLYDTTHLAERDEIAAMKDSMKIGLFFMDKNFIIQDHYSRYLEEMLSEENLHGKNFIDIIADSVTATELGIAKD
jgi:hypothetical protein